MTEGENGKSKFRFTRKGVSNPDITVRYTLSQNGSFLTSGQTGTRSILIPSMNMTSGPQQHKFLDLNVHDDNTTKPSGSVTIVLLEDPSYYIEEGMGWVRVRIYDDD